ncbi:MAG: hypothetical protein ABI215_09515 [Mycobacterium sp.]
MSRPTLQHLSIADLSGGCRQERDVKVALWPVTITIQTTDADNPHYVAAKLAILDSLEVRLPDR